MFSLLNGPKTKSTFKLSNHLKHQNEKIDRFLRLPMPDIKPGPEYIQDRVQRQHRPRSGLSVFQAFSFEPHEIPATEATVF